MVGSGGGIGIGQMAIIFNKKNGNDPPLTSHALVKRIGNMHNSMHNEDAGSAATDDEPVKIVPKGFAVIVIVLIALGTLGNGLTSTRSLFVYQVPSQTVDHIQSLVVILQGFVNFKKKKQSDVLGKRRTIQQGRLRWNQVCHDYIPIRICF